MQLDLHPNGRMVPYCDFVVVDVIDNIVNVIVCNEDIILKAFTIC